MMKREKLVFPGTLRKQSKEGEQSIKIYLQGEREKGKKKKLLFIIKRKGGQKDVVRRLEVLMSIKRMRKYPQQGGGIKEYEGK